MRSYSFKDSKKDLEGRKTTITITTENPEVIKKLIESAASNSDFSTSQDKKKKDSVKAKTKEASRTKPKVLTAPKPIKKGKRTKNE